MNKFANRRRFLISMFFISINNQGLNYAIFMQLLADLMLEDLIWKDIADPEEFYGDDQNEYMAFIEGCK